MTKTAHNQPKDDTFAEHQRWGGTYLVVADESEEFEAALKYAVRMANSNKCRLGILYIIEDQGFMHWGNVQKRVHDDQRDLAEKILNKACIDVEDHGGSIPSLYIQDGGRIEALSNVLDNDPSISMLILGGGTQGSGPGPLVTHFTGKGFSRLNIPVMVIPEHVDF